MMRTRITAILLSVLCLAVLLTGCVRTELGVVLEKDGTGTVTTTVAIEEDAYNMIKQNGSDPFEGRETKKVTYDDTAYISCSDATEKLSYEELENHLKAVRLDASDETSPLLFRDVSIDKSSGLFYSSYSFQAQTAVQESTEESGRSVNDTYKFFVTVTMPGSITQTRGGTADGNTVTFEVQDLTQENDMAVYADFNHIGVIIAIVMALILILGAVIFFGRKKGQRE